MKTRSSNSTKIIEWKFLRRIHLELNKWTVGYWVECCFLIPGFIVLKKTVYIHDPWTWSVMIGAKSEATCCYVQQFQINIPIITFSIIGILCRWSYFLCSQWVSQIGTGTMYIVQFFVFLWFSDLFLFILHTIYVYTSFILLCTGTQFTCTRRF